MVGSLRSALRISGGAGRTALRRALLPVICIALAGYFVRTAPEISGDGRLAFVYAVVDEHGIALDRYVAESPVIEEDLAIYAGHDYMAKPPLPALLAIPPYALLRLLLPPAHMDSYWWKWVLTLIVSGGSLVATVLLVERLAMNARLAAARRAALATAVATPLIVYSTFLVATALSAALLAGIALAAFQRRGLLVGLLFGALVSTDTVVGAGAIVPLTLLGAEALRERSAARVLRIGLGIALGTLPLLIYQAAAFGSPFASMYRYLSDPQQRAAFASIDVGLPAPDLMSALLASPRNGLFVVAPIALLGTILLIRVWRAGVTDRRLVVITGGSALATVVAFAALPADLVFWPFRAEYGPRLLVPVLPLLCWPLAALRTRVLALATFLGAVPQLAAVAIHQPMLNPGATFQVGEIFRRLVGDVATPSLIGLALPDAIPERMWLAQIGFVVAALALLARDTLVHMRGQPAA